MSKKELALPMVAIPNRVASIVRGILSLGHGAAGIYYLLIGVGTIAGFVREFSGQHPLLRAVATYVAIGSAWALLAVLPAIIRRASRSSSAIPKWNPFIEVESLEVEYVVKRAESLQIDRRRLRAIKPVALYTFGVASTGSGPVKVDLKSEGSLHGPVATRQFAHYQVMFPRPLVPGDKYESQLTMLAPDPEQRMKPYFTLKCANYAGYGSLKMKVRFEDRLPQRVSAEVYSLLTEVPMEPIMDLYPGPDKTVEFRRDRLVNGCGYTIAWVW